jgi:cytochrome oxidase Cu insertion factor (SCO1/SenC/PrrC family)
VGVRAPPSPRPSGPGAGQELRPSGIPASISTSMADLMSLSPLPAAPAPGFTLTDQAGRTMSLAGFRGKVVVLEFMDVHCTDICPIVAQEFADAYRDLGPAARKVIFAAINVNPYYSSVAAVAAFSAEQRLTTIPGWHFFTGSVPALRAAWQAYHIEVRAPSPSADVIHTSAIFFIDPRGMERYLASPLDAGTTKPRVAYGTQNETGYVPAGQMADWGHGIALLARSLASRESAYRVRNSLIAAAISSAWVSRAK